MNKNIVIIHYNTPRLTDCLVRSINLFVEDAVIYIFDNSDKLPFSSADKYDNVTLIDNTKGQVINFNEWLNKYPTKRRSHGKVNNWGSAKHCYSIEKCMELLGENFLLLDSDILLKKDISDLFDEECIYVGETITQPLSTIKRILPFMCFINVDMCKEKKVHYFDHNYMHGLAFTRNNQNADKYDTGAGFYLHASKFKHKDIKLDNYLVHYGHGSWKKIGDRPHFTAEEWLEINKKLWSNEMNKNVVYTCITGKYDTLLEPTVVSKGFDYVCFTDNKDFKSEVWDIRPMPESVKSYSSVKQQRYVKVNAHEFLPEYDLSVWVDGNVVVKGDMNKLAASVVKDDCSIYVPQHPTRKCIYSESKIVLAMKKDVSTNVNPQMKRYKEEGFPENYGLLQSNIMIRKHNNEDCMKLMRDWSNEILNGSHRDQLSFNYCSWKNKDVKIHYLDRKIYDSQWFHWNKGHRKATKASIKHQKSRSNMDKSREEFRRLINIRKLMTHNIMIY